MADPHYRPVGKGARRGFPLGVALRSAPSVSHTSPMGVDDSEWIDGVPAHTKGGRG